MREQLPSPGRGVPVRLVVLAKEPVPGRVKTRLVPPLDPAHAAIAHEAFVADTLGRLTGAFAGCCALELAVSPDWRSPILRGLAGKLGWRCVAQGEGNLGERMRRQLIPRHEPEEIRIVLGADTPDLPPSYVATAVDVLSRAAASCVVGPAVDGGYYLFGVRGAVPEVFSGVPWGGATVFADTMRRLRVLGVTAHELPRWRDLDDWSDMVAMAERLGGEAARTANPACDSLIKRLRRAGFSI